MVVTPFQAYRIETKTGPHAAFHNAYSYKLPKLGDNDIDTEEDNCALDPILLAAIISSFNELELKIFGRSFRSVSSNEIDEKKAEDQILMDHCDIYDIAKQLAEDYCSGSTVDCEKACAIKTWKSTNMLDLSEHYRTVVKTSGTKPLEVWKAAASGWKGGQLEQKLLFSAAAGCGHAICQENVTVVCLLEHVIISNYWNFEMDDASLSDEVDEAKEQQEAEIVKEPIREEPEREELLIPEESRLHLRALGSCSGT
ncbi:unnamed protein product [Cylicocyclus nassatus]|uniref:Uncharacterized protein n=1 Tax=Cylicocyclus nassatus TaxID=53992 RepID=A0AA36GP00_CYLNA|nr:unnamed protein product [Cylicocyclus nassatus]